MSNVIEVLARAGETGALDVNALPRALRIAVSSGNKAEIAPLLGTSPVYACMVVAPENEPEPCTPAEQPQEDEPQPDADAA